MKKTNEQTKQNKKQESKIHKQEKVYSTETALRKQMLDSLRNHFKSAILK